MRAPAPIVILALVAAGCGGGGGDPSSTEGAGMAPSAADVERAIARMVDSGEPVPLPPSRVLTVDPDVIRLSHDFDQAEVESSWSVPARDPFVATAGPASSREPGEGGRWRRYNVRGVKLAALELSGFRFEAAEAGQILIRARIRNSPYFILRWPGSPGMQIDVAAGDEFAEYSISTEGLAKWAGSIDRTSLLVPVENDGPEPEIDLELLGFVRRASAFAAAAGVQRMRIDRVVREALFLHGGTQVTFPEVRPAPESRLSLSASVLGAPQQLEVVLERGGERQVLIDEQISDATSWTGFNVALPAGAGPARVAVRATGPTEGVVFLSSPTLYAPHPAPRRVIFYLIDTLGAKHTSLDGYHRQTTPELARLAAQGAHFRNAFANAAYTPESVPSLMTSLHTRSHSLTRMFQRLSPDFLTLQEAFQAAGWATVAFSTNANAGPERATDLGFDSFYDHLAFGGYEPGLRTAPIDQIVSWLEAHRDRPAFLYIHTAEPHSPYEPPPPFKYLFDPEYDARLGRQPLPQHLAMTNEPKYSERELEHLEALYDGEVAFADYVVGALHRLLEGRGLLEDTLLVVTADHGEEFMEQGRVGHGGGVNTQLLKVPLVLWGEGVRPGSEIAQNVQLLDLMPTLLDLAGIEIEAPMQGDSLTPLLAGRVEGFDRRPIMAATYMPSRPRFTLIEGHWKLNVQAPGRYRANLDLFDLAADPGEQNDLEDQHPEIVGAMLQRLANLYGALPRYRGQTAERHQISQEQIERLKALGYLQ